MSWALKISFDKSKVSNMGTNRFFLCEDRCAKGDRQFYCNIFGYVISPHRNSGIPHFL